MNPWEVWEWESFCQHFGIGDRHHDTHFDFMIQSVAKIELLRKFSKNPSGMLLMYGVTGTGKTYASLATLRSFTEMSRSAAFYTHKEMHEKWLDTFKNNLSTFKKTVFECALLVIDDLSGSTPAFSEFIFDVIDRRGGYMRKGTIVTTNLTEDKLKSLYSDAFMRRLNDGHILSFKDKMTRKRDPI